jgi:hypothetical protein
MELAQQVLMGLGLAACCGLRAFLPLLALGLAGRLQWIQLGAAYDWLGGTPALTVFGVAVVAELLADKVPIVDHAFDTAATLIKPVAGCLVVAPLVADWTPLSTGVLLMLAGGSLAGIVHLAKAQLRLLSTAFTGGFGNPALSTIEDAGAAAGSVLVILLPIAAAMLVFALVLALLGVVLWRRAAT